MYGYLSRVIHLCVAGKLWYVVEMLILGWSFIGHRVMTQKFSTAMMRMTIISCVDIVIPYWEAVLGL